MRYSPQDLYKKILGGAGERRAAALVKTRTGDAFGSPAAAVDGRKRRRYRDIARYFLSSLGAEVNIRFDVLEVTKEGVEWLKNAFEG